MAEIYKVEFKVRSYEVDIYGHVNNATYMNYLEQARNEFLALKEMSYKQLMERGVFFALVHTSINYRAESFVDEVLIATGEIIHFGNSSIRLKHEIINKKNGKLIVDAEAVIAFTDGKRPIPIPDFFRKAFETN